MFGSGSLLLFSACETDFIIKDQINPFFSSKWFLLYQELCSRAELLNAFLTNLAGPVKHFDALKLGLNSTFSVKADPGIAFVHLFKKTFLHAEGEKIRDGSFAIALLSSLL